MAEFHYEALTFLDSSFLALESRSVHMHVAGVAIFDAAPLMTETGGIDIDKIRGHIESKLQYIPRYRQRLEWVPYNRRPVWVDDEHFNFDFHVRHTSLPRPGTQDQLKKLSGRIMSMPLDHDKPLWELWVIEGLEDNQFALIVKIHHCMIDGLSGVDLSTILLNVTPSPEIEEAPEWEPRPAPTPSQLAVAEAAKATRRLTDRLASLADNLKEGKGLSDDALDKSSAAMNSLRSGWLSAADRTPLNPEIGPNRRFDWTDMKLDEVKEIKKGLGGTLNDTILAITAGAVREFLIDERDFDVSDSEFRVMNPVSTRVSDQRGALGNQIAMWLIDLPISEPDPVRRLELIRERTFNLKKTNHALGAATLVEISSGTPITLLSMANRVAGPRMRPFNMTVTNVPGPQFPMYLLEAEMKANYPLVPLWSQHGLGVALFSYNGNLLWGIHTDYDALPDSDRFVTALQASANQLRSAARA
jgi:diacylglycerol O-acyltransferase / wax synthase